MTTYPQTSNYIAGKAGTGAGGDRTVVDPSTGKPIWTFRADNEATVATAVDAAAATNPE